LATTPAAAVDATIKSLKDNTTPAGPSALSGHKPYTRGESCVGAGPGDQLDNAIRQKRHR